ncbi:unnamed protein product [Cylicostephanus goldi]|uniref:Uncharacterized protein n=1 Tax=Cylicostephanus goldi TaxID=71465 RepID=A0A3P6SZR4_CYLGO|nr:unnamed protein product [Cylicostephanus goldi]
MILVQYSCDLGHIVAVYVSLLSKGYSLADAEGIRNQVEELERKDRIASSIAKIIYSLESVNFEDAAEKYVGYTPLSRNPQQYLCLLDSKSDDDFDGS